MLRFRAAPSIRLTRRLFRFARPLLCALLLTASLPAAAEVLYSEDFHSGSRGWYLGPEAHRRYASMNLDESVAGEGSPSLRVNLPAATLNTYLASPTLALSPEESEYTVSFRARVIAPDSPFQVQLAVLDSLGNWLRLQTLLELVGQNMDGTRSFRHSFRAAPEDGARACRLFFGLPFRKAFREGAFWVDDVVLRSGHEAEALELYVRPASVPPGGVVDLHVSCGRGTAALRIYRETSERAEYAPARELTGLQAYPVPEAAYRNGCDWPAAASIEVGADWPPGVYEAELDDGDHIVWASFVVRPVRREGAVLVELPTHTDQAYNGYGGLSFYTGPPSPEVSFDRPTPSSLYTASIHLIRWLSREGIPFAVATDDDLHDFPEMLLDYPALALTWHSEYWTRTMREGVEDYIAAGGSVLSLSGNTCWWQTRMTEERHLVCYKYAARSDPVWSSDSALVTTHWDEPPLNDPPNRFLGLSWREGGMVNWSTSSSCPCPWDWLLGHGGYTVDAADHWVFAGTGLGDGADLGRDFAIVGYEVDGAPVEWIGGRPVIDPAGGTPDGFVPLGHARCFNQYRSDSTGVALLGILDRGSSFVFNGGTTGWCWGLPHDPQVQTITRNLIQRLAEHGPGAASVVSALKISAFPNPARDGIDFVLSGVPRPARVQVFEVGGQLLNTLTIHRTTHWDLRDGAGRTLPAGTYWVAAEGRPAVRIVRLP